ncbi:MAG: ISNCY family transposase [Deltaproteobacteria bacterium]|nr:ISNCY family transposase [Deltaproteobacteria bacterium]
MVRQAVIKRLDSGELTSGQAAVLLGLSIRQVRRLRRRFEAQGAAGLSDGRSGARRKRRLSEGTAQQIAWLYGSRYSDFSIRHFHDKLCEAHGIKVSYSKVRQILQQARLVLRQTRRGQYRRRRPRQPMVGMRIHMDGSTHAWFGDDKPIVDLVIALDDADGRLLSARFVPQEGTLSTLGALSDVLRRYGRFAELYLDRGSHHYPYEGVTDHQVTRVLKALSIRAIYARSPQARGRCERAFGTLQGRLPQELRLRRIATIEAANTFLESTFIDDFNRRFTVTPQDAGSAFVELVHIDLELLLSIHDTRVVRNDFTVHHGRRVLQLQCDAPVSPKATVIVHTLLDGHLAISRYGRCIARFKPDGSPLQKIGASTSPGGLLPTPGFHDRYLGDLMLVGGGHL